MSDLLTSAMRTVAGVPSWAVQQLRATADKIATLDPAMVARLLEPDRLLRAASVVQARTFEGVRISASPRATTAALVEVRNKAQVFLLVSINRQVLGIPSPAPSPFPLEEYLKKAYERDPYAALWAVEGLGHVYGQSYLDRGEGDLTGILCASATQMLPDKALLMLHAGIGLAFAQKLLAGLAPHPSFADLVEPVAQFAKLCRSNSQPGYMGAAVESMGLVARTFHVGLVGEIDRAIKEAHSDLRAYFWHGVGRAIYFLYVNFLPCSTWETVMMCEREAVDELSRLNLFAGVAWGMVMVNIRNPEILANLVIEPHGSELLNNRGFRNGVFSSLIMRQDTTPGVPFIREFIRYSKCCSRPGEQNLWDSLIRIPGEEGLEKVGPALKSRHSLDQIFRYSEFPELTGISPPENTR